MIQVAGVMFNNDAIDGGRNRQDILKEIMDAAAAPGEVQILVKTEYLRRKDGSYGIRLKDYVTDEVLGWIHKETADAIIQSGNKPDFYLGYVDYHGCYHVKLDDIPFSDIPAIVTEYDEKKENYNGKSRLDRIIEGAGERVV